MGKEVTRQYLRIGNKVFFHPGLYIEENMYSYMAAAIGISEECLNGLINGRINVDESLAKKLGETFGTSAQMWINLQDKYNEGVKLYWEE